MAIPVVTRQCPFFQKMNFLAEIQFVLATTNPNNVSDENLDSFIKSSDIPVGVCGNRVRILFGYIDSLAEKLADYDECLNDKHAEKHSLFSKWRGEAFILRQKIGACRAMVQIMLHEDFPELLHKNSVNVRKGWVVVYSLDKKEEGVSQQESKIMSAVGKAVIAEVARRQGVFDPGVN